MENNLNPIMHRIQKPERKISANIYLIFGLVLFGLFSGYILSRNFNLNSNTAQDKQGSINIGGKKTAGSVDSKVFPDQAEGELKSGGINGEGTHKLIRPGGDNQTVYLTSSMLDLTEFEGKKVRVWGETRAAQKAGWLMDVGKVEIL